MPDPYLLRRTRHENAGIVVHSFGIVLSVFCVTSVAWIIMLHALSSQVMSAMMHEGFIWERMVDHTPMWVAMFVGMMLPLATVSIIGSSQDEKGRLVPFAGLCFATGYVASCLAFAFVATTLEEVIHLSSWRLASVAGLCIIGIYQFTPTKLKALSMCKGDLFRSRVQSRTSLSMDLISGIRHSTGCLKCCGLAMLTPIFFGMTNGGLMAALFFWMLLEQAGWISVVATRVVGASFVIFGLVLALRIHTGA